LWGSVPAWGLGEKPTTPHCKRNILLLLDLGLGGFFEHSNESSQEGFYSV